MQYYTRITSRGIPSCHHAQPSRSTLTSRCNKQERRVPSVPKPRPLLRFILSFSSPNTGSQEEYHAYLFLHCRFQFVADRCDGSTVFPTGQSLRGTRGGCCPQSLSVHQQSVRSRQFAVCSRSWRMLLLMLCFWIIPAILRLQ